MNKHNKLLKFLKKKIIKDWSVDEAFRYLAVIDKSKQSKVKWGRALEVGSGDFGITPYLKKVEIVGLDTWFSSQPSILNRVIGNATSLPFADNSFDTVLTVDCLEHVSHDLYLQVFTEMFRVAKKQVIISMPCDKSAYELDKQLDNYYLNKFGERNHFLKEHVDNGQVSQSEIYNFIQSGLLVNDKIGQIKSWPIMNVYSRHLYMTISFQQGVFFRILYYSLLIFVPLRRFFNVGNCYWRLFIIKIND